MPEYRELEFDEANEAEIQAHGLTPQQVESVLDNDPRFFRNKKGRAGTRLMVGPDSGGQFLSIPIIETPVPGRWRPVTAWVSNKAQQTMWRKAI